MLITAPGILTYKMFQLWLKWQNLLSRKLTSVTRLYESIILFYFVTFHRLCASYHDTTKCFLVIES